MRKAITFGGPHAENTAWCRAELALMSFHTGALLPAEREAEQALEKTPRNLHVLAVMGRIKTAKKEYAAAIDFYRRAIDIAPNHDALVALGDLYALTGRPEDAEVQYKRVIELHTSVAAHSHGDGTHSHPHSHGNAQLARFYADHDRNLTEALEEAEAAYRTYKNIFTMDTLAWCYYKNGRYENARKVIDKVLKFRTPDAAIFFHAGMIYEKIGNRPTAQKYLYQALSLNANFHPIYAAVAADVLKQLSSR
jgi:tetratricopeptide (TPR) repeat protein